MSTIAVMECSQSLDFKTYTNKTKQTCLNKQNSFIVEIEEASYTFRDNNAEPFLIQLADLNRKQRPLIRLKADLLFGSRKVS